MSKLVRNIEAMDLDYFQKNAYFVVDFENTGGNLSDGHKITAVGLCIVQPRGEKMKITKKFSTLINPEREIPEFIEKLIGIKTSQVNNPRYPKVEKIFEKLEKMFNYDKIFVAHGTKFDYNMYNHLYLQKYRKNLHCVHVDTCKLAKKLFDINKANIGNMAELFELDFGRHHQPDFDAYVASQILIKSLRLLRRKPELLSDFRTSVSIFNG
ncbi:MAG: exonuclease domain-containing protein [bacterium]|nr:exonuclease domain-containing protein [bacterium]